MPIFKMGKDKVGEEIKRKRKRKKRKILKIK